MKDQRREMIVLVLEIIALAGVLFTLGVVMGWTFS
jgi:hypothetical protein